ncbi:15565_t:CDS:1, partial [Funneliformis caledonium]
AISSCSCSVRMTDTLYKYQEAISMRFHIISLNFIPLLTLND